MLIRNLAAAALLLVMGVAPRAYAQTFDGLDLTDDAPKKVEPKKNDDAPRARPKDRDDARRPVAKKDGEASTGEHDTTQDDRVKSVQRKLYMKRGRFELNPMFIFNVNDPYYTKFGGALRAAFHPADTLAISARFSLIDTLPTDDVRTAKKNLQSRIFYSVPIWSALADVEWSPLYGKVAIFNSILHWDAFLTTGGGVVYTETSAAVGRTVNPAFDLGLGLRFIAKDWLAVNVGLVNTTYVDTPSGSTKGVTQNLMMLSVGLSVFMPFKSSFREAE